MRVAFLWRAVLLSLILFGLTLPSASAQTGPSPTTAPTASPPAQPILKIAGNSEQNKITLQQSGLTVNQPLTVLETSGQVQSGVFSFTTATTELRSQADQNNAVAASMVITITPGAGPVVPFQTTPLTLTGTAPRVGNYTGLLFLQYRDATGLVKGQTVYTLEVQVSVAAPKLDVRQPLISDGSLNFATSSTTLTSSIFLVETGNQDFSDPVTATVTFSDLSGTSTNAPVTVETPTFPVQPKMSTNVNFKVTLPEVDKYRGAVTVKYGDKVDTYPLMVTRNLPAASQITMTVASEGNVMRQLGFIQNQNLKMNIQVRESAGKSVVYYLPILEMQPRPGGWQYQKDYDNFAAIGPVNSASPILTRTLQPGAVHNYVMEIQGVPTIGNQKGKVVLTTPDGGRSEIEFEVNIKDGPLWPGLVVLCGIGFAILLRRYLTIGRPRRRRRLQLRLTYNQFILNLNQDDPFFPVFVAWFNQVDEANQAGTLTQADFDSEIAKFGGRLKNYVYVRDVLALQPNLASYVPDAAARQPLTTKFRNIQDTLDRQKLDALDGGVTNPLALDAASLFHAIVDESKKEIKTSVTTLTTAIGQISAVFGKAKTTNDDAQPGSKNPTGAQPGTPVTPTGNQPTSPQPTITPVTGDEATSPTTATPPDASDTRPGESAGPVDEARAKAEALYKTAFLLKDKFQTLEKGANDLAALVASQPPTDNQATLDKNAEFIKRYNSLNASFETLAADCAASLTAWFVAFLDWQLLLHPKASAKWKGKVIGLERQAQSNAAASNLDPQAKLANLSGIFDSWEKIKATVNRPLARPTGPNFALGNFDFGDLFERTMPAFYTKVGSTLSTVHPPRQISFAAPQFKDLLSDITWRDFWVGVVLAVVSMLVGLQLFWTNNNTFGSWSDYFSLFLWGFGLNQVTQANTALTGDLAAMNPWTMGDAARTGGGSNATPAQSNPGK